MSAADLSGSDSRNLDNNDRGRRGRAIGVTIAVYDDLGVVEAEWRAFEEEAEGTVFQTFGWLSTWHNHIGAREDVRPAIVVGKDEAGETLFLLPLATRAAKFGRELVWLGSDLCDYNGPLLARRFPQAVDRDAFARLWKRIGRDICRSRALAYDLVRLEKMADTVGGHPNPMLFLPTQPHPSGAWLTGLAPTWDDFYGQKRSSDTRQRDRSKRKRLNALGQIEYVEPRDQPAVLRSLATLMRQKSGSFARMGVSNLFDKPGHADFYRALATDPRSAHLVHVSQLNVGDDAAAVNVGLTFKGRYYHLLASHTDNEKIARFGPGATHLHEILRHAIDRGHACFDFTIGDEKYKAEWCEERQTLHDHVRARTLRGALGAFAVTRKQRLKRMIKQTPALWNAFTKTRAALARWSPRKPAAGDAAS